MTYRCLIMIQVQAIQYLVNSSEQIYIHGFDGHSRKYKYIHYYDKEETRTSEHAWRKGRTDHNLQKEIDYMNYLKEQKKVIELDKDIGEPGNLVLDGKTIAHGEIVQINKEKLGIRIVGVVQE